jgi:hypothetical protein
MKPQTLLRLYPRSWRERYGGEFLALLEKEGTGPRVVLNVLAGAFDAWISPRVHAAEPLLSGPIGPRVLLIPPDRPALATHVLFTEPGKRPAVSPAVAIALALTMFGLLFGLSGLAARVWGDAFAVRALERGVLPMALAPASVPAWFSGYTIRTKIAAGFWLMLVMYGFAAFLEWLR